MMKYVLTADIFDNIWSANSLMFVIECVMMQILLKFKSFEIKLNWDSENLVSIEKILG